MTRLICLLIAALVMHLAVLTGGVLTAQEGLFSFLTPNRTKIANNLKQLALGMHNYHDTFKSFAPTGLDYPAEPGKPKEQLSWRVRLLPFIGEQELFQQFNFNEPWDGPTNKPLLAKMPEIYKSPGAKVDDPTKTVYQVVTMAADAAAFEKAVRQAHPQQRAVATGFDMIYQGRRRPSYPPSRIVNMLDGTSNSVLIVEVDAKHAVPWTKPEDLAFEFDKPWAKLGGLRNGHVNFAMADGSVGSLPKDKVSDQMLRDLFFISDGRRIDWRDLRAGVRY